MDNFKKRFPAVSLKFFLSANQQRQNTKRRALHPVD